MKQLRIVPALALALSSLATPALAAPSWGTQPPARSPTAPSLPAPRSTTPPERVTGTPSLPAAPMPPQVSIPTVPSRPSSAPDGAVQAYQQAYAAVINQVLRLIDQAQQALAKLPVPSGASCGSQSKLQQLTDALTAQLSKVQAATTVAELQEITRDTVALLKSEQDAFTAGVTAYVDCVYDATLAAEKTYLASARAQAQVLKLKKQDVTALLADIESADALVGESEAQHAAATTTQQKAVSYQTLAKSAPYIQSISAALGGSGGGASTIPSMSR